MSQEPALARESRPHITVYLQLPESAANRAAVEDSFPGTIAVRMTFSGREPARPEAHRGALSGVK